jgi:ATP-dependent RNA helicase DeaD
MGVRVLPIYGGAPMGRQLSALERGVDVVVATPGRALDHVGRGSLRLAEIRVLVLDEADEMLDMGFEEDLRALLDAMPTERQTALFSATMARAVAGMASSYLRDPARVEIERAPLAAGEVPRVRQTAYVVPRAHKTTALGRVLDMEAPTSAIVFCRTRTEVDELTERLAARGYNAEALHGGMGQEARDRVMRRFRAGQLELLIATDVAARGLDVQNLSHVVNYDVPNAPDAYVHRIGRTGRAGREGVAVTIAEPREHRLLRNIERVTGQRIEMASVPTVADLRTRRLELTRSAVREALVSAMQADEDDDGASLERFRAVVQSLADEFDLMDVAAAAVSVAHEAAAGDGEDDEAEIPTVALGAKRRDRVARDEGGGRYGGREAEGRVGRGERPDRPPRQFDDRPVDRDVSPDEGDDAGRAERGDRPERPRRPRREDSWSTARLYVGAGRLAGIRPGDIVGAIANEAGVDAGAIGAIEITDRFTLVELPATIVDEVAEALRGTTLRGKRVVARRDRDRDGGQGDEGSDAPPRRPRPRDRGFDRGFGARDDRDAGGARGGSPRGRGRFGGR